MSQDHTFRIELELFKKRIFLCSRNTFIAKKQVLQVLEFKKLLLTKSQLKETVKS